ncbi:hypothetical protein V1478_018768, partial [Vespula squamosa]
IRKVRSEVRDSEFQDVKFVLTGGERKRLRKRSASDPISREPNCVRSCLGIKRLKLTRNTFALETSVRLYVQAAPNDSNPAGCYPGKRRSFDSTVKPPTKRPFARNVPLLPIPKSSETPVPTLRRAKVF